MHSSGFKELRFLERIALFDPQGKKHVIKLLDHFEFQGHLCLVLELLRYAARDDFWFHPSFI